MATSWQHSITSNKKRLSDLCRTGNMSDVTFVVGTSPETKKRFRLHKFVLATWSDVFFAMFYGSLPEKDQVEVTDIEPATFGSLVKFMYEDSFSVLSMEDAMLIYCAAEKYNLAHLRSLCTNYITNNLNVQNIPILYGMPNVLETLQVKSKCDDILSKNAAAILRSNNFSKSPFELVKNILQLDYLDIEGEAEVFLYVMIWVKSSIAESVPDPSKASLRGKIDPLLPHIRFLAMSLEEFVSGPARSGILTDGEKASITENLVEPGCRELPSWCNKSNTRTTIRSLRIVENHVCYEWSCDNGYGHLFGGGTASIEHKIHITRGSLKFRGVSFMVDEIDGNVPKAELLVYPQHERIKPTPYFRGFEATPHESMSTSSYDSETSLLRCTLSRPFIMDCNKTYLISVKLEHCFFKLCSYNMNNTTQRTETFEFYLFDGTSPVMQCLDYSTTNLGHFHEIFYS